MVADAVEKLAFTVKRATIRKFDSQVIFLFFSPCVIVPSRYSKNIEKLEIGHCKPDICMNMCKLMSHYVAPAMHFRSDLPVPTYIRILT